jgi:RNA polymerase sigma-70 factor, ECF subfamily
MDFNKLVNKHSNQIKKIIKSELKYSNIDHDDLYQEICIKLWKGLDTFESKSDVRTWVHSISMNTIKNYFKKESNIPSKLSIDLFNPKNLDNRLKTLDTPLSILEEQEKGIIEENILFNKINKLSKLEKEVYNLRYNKEMTVDEITVELNKPIGTIVSIMSRMKKKLC